MQMQMSDENERRSVVDVVHSAWELLLAGDVDGAHVLLHSVVQECHDYSTFYVVLGAALLSSRDHAGALHAAKRAVELTPGSPHARLIVAIAQERLTVKAEPREQEIADPALEQPKPRRTLSSLLDPLSEAERSTQFDLDRTADELTRERPLVRPIPEPEHIQPVELPEPEDAPALVSETLAEIMIRQGKLTDAKEVYIQLSRLQPERYPHFKAKIEAIDKLLLGTSIAPETTTAKRPDTDPVA
jgi:hypothetical protein